MGIYITRILVKAASGLPSPQLMFGAAAVNFTVSPLFTSIGRQPALGAAAGEFWQILTPAADLTDQNAWDICHALLQQGFGIAGVPAPKFAEPDLQQQWITGRTSDVGLKLSQSCGPPDPQNANYPCLGDTYWFRDPDHSQFDAAIATIGGPNVTPKVRIAHFDTGYDLNHRTLPRYLRTDMARNFVDPGTPNDATDRSSGPLNTLGHGTGTLSLLAGASKPGDSLLGGAPFAEVVPVRVADCVVLFFNSAIAQAFDYVHGVNASGGNRIDIITMSMGGLASQAWAEAVNAVYEQGVFIVTAAGNNFGNLPMHNIVYPARFGRVVAACGVMANGKPYADLPIYLMAGNYGPDSKMTTAIAAPTPNTPWARFGCEDIIDFDGGGTSGATPQVAAAAALWVQKNRSAVDAYPKAWMRVEAIRKALFDSATANPPDMTHLGHGDLRARAALDKAPAAAASLTETMADHASFPLFGILTGLGMQVAGRPKADFVQRLRIYPHALRAKNAYYSPDHKALLLGYFTASTADPGSVLPGGVVFTAVSHDIVAHETTHALLDGLHRRFREATNPDVFAFHEAFADIVALFQHFTLPEALRHQIAETRGDLEKQNLLGQLAVQFGEATGRYGALRDYIGKIIKVKRPLGEPADAGDDSKPDTETKNVWVRRDPERTDYDNAQEPHDRGAVLVAAVFDAFLQIYKRRTMDLLRLATDGTGILPPGAISTDLVNRLAREASKVAGHVLNICIRALDYCPPIDLTFGEYLRALITADADLVANDKFGYRTAFIAAFRNRGIYPRDVKHLAPGSLVWEPPPLPLRQAKVRAVLDHMSVDWDLNVERTTAYRSSNENAATFWRWLMNPDQVSDEEIETLGLVRIDQPQQVTIGPYTGELRRIEVHSVRPARRVGPDGNIRSDLVVEITQSFRPAQSPGARYRGGCTLLIDLATAEVRYMVRKKVKSSARISAQLDPGGDAKFGLHDNYFADDAPAREPFALMHRVYR